MSQTDIQQLRDSKIMTQRIVLGFTLEAIAAFHGMTQADVRTVLVDSVAELKAQGMSQEKILASVAKDDVELITSLSQGVSGNDQELQNQMLRAEVESLRSRVTHLETMVSQLMQHQAAASVPPPPQLLRTQNQFFGQNPGFQRNWSQVTTSSSLHPEENWNANWWQTRS